MDGPTIDSSLAFFFFNQLLALVSPVPFHSFARPAPSICNLSHFAFPRRGRCDVVHIRNKRGKPSRATVFLTLPCLYLCEAGMDPVTEELGSLLVGA